MILFQALCGFYFAEEMKDLLKNAKDILADTVPYIRQGVPVVMELSSVHQELVATTEEEMMELERLVHTCKYCNVLLCASILLCAVSFFLLFK